MGKSDEKLRRGKWRKSGGAIRDTGPNRITGQAWVSRVVTGNRIKYQSMSIRRKVRGGETK